MVKAVYLLGDVAERGATMIEIRCGRCDRYGRLSVARLLAEYGPNADMGAVLRALVGDCPKRDARQIQDRCDPFCPTLVELFFRPGAGRS